MALCVICFITLKPATGKSVSAHEQSKPDWWCVLFRSTFHRILSTGKFVIQKQEKWKKIDTFKNTGWAIWAEKLCCS